MKHVSDSTHNDSVNVVIKEKESETVETDDTVGQALVYL